MSRARLARYMTAAAGNIDLALQIYEKNLALSEALFGLLHGLEIAVRNSIHHVLSTDIGRQDWYRDGHPLPFPIAPTLRFTGPMNGMIADARSHAGAGAPVGKVIAELTNVRLLAEHDYEPLRKPVSRQPSQSISRRQAATRADPPSPRDNQALAEPYRAP